MFVIPNTHCIAHTHIIPHRNRLKTIVQRRFFMNYTCVSSTSGIYVLCYVLNISRFCRVHWTASESDGNVAMVWVILFRWRYACIVCKQTSYQLVLKNKINIFYTFWFGIIRNPNKMHTLKFVTLTWDEWYR